MILLAEQQPEQDTMPEPPVRQAWRHAVATVATQAKAALPECHGRIDKAVKLVLAGDVALHSDGTATVGSASTAEQRCTVNGQCDCKDFPRAPDGRCAHMLAKWIYKRATALAQQEMSRMDMPDQTWVERARQQPALTPPFPEAPASVNVRLMMCGREVQVTLRDSNEGRLLQRLDALLQRFPLETAAATGQHGPDWCATHQAQMKENHKDGSTWYSHRKAEGGWCKGA